MFHPLTEAVIKGLPKRGTVVEFGNQRFDGRSEHDTTKQFYLDQGFDSYTAIDVNTDMDAIVADLNKVMIDPEQFDVVTNNGTGEHIFNQAAVFENAHNLCKVGGYMVHILPLLPWVNHGFYNFQPILFRDLALANRYGIKDIFIANRWGQTIKLTAQELFDERRPEALTKAAEKLIKADRKAWEQVAVKPEGMDQEDFDTFLRLRGDVSVVAILKRKHEEAFKFPIQGKYRGDVQDESLRDEYDLEDTDGDN